jgi:ribonuclease E
VLTAIHGDHADVIEPADAMSVVEQPTPVVEESTPAETNAIEVEAVTVDGTEDDARPAGDGSVEVGLLATGPVGTDSAAPETVAPVEDAPAVAARPRRRRAASRPAGPPA